MPAIRTRIDRPRRRKFSARAIATFRQMKNADDDKYWKLHSILWDEIDGLKPWNFPCVLPPDELAKSDTDRAAQNLWRELDAAS